ncbi:MAG: glycoside-pentoside-hexuronide (GPH):cation symporter [Lachnospiraceae bacterium]|nr:glycoside-pentoside-hexuronide (GPH):cation symporter [Lachnospiraceae bacterium]
MEQTEKKYLKWYNKLVYGAGDLASNTSYGLVSSFVLLYLSDTMGLDTGIIGTLMLVSKIFDGISDVIFGNLIDHTKSKLGKARPWMLYGQIGVSLCLVLLFSIPQGIGQTAQYAFFFAFYTALNAVFYTANGIAYSALSALITHNKNERVQLGSFRFMFAVVTNIVMGFSVTMGVEAFGGGATGWRMVAIICAVIGLIVNTISCLSVKELPEDADTEKAADTEKVQDDNIGFTESVKLLLCNKYYILIVSIYIVYYFMSNLTTGSGIYFMQNVLGDGSLLGMFSMMKMFPVIIALIFTPILVNKLKSMQKINFWGYLISDIFGLVLIYFASQRNVAMMLLFMFIKGIFAGTLTGTLNALIAEIAGYTYRTKGVHIDGMMFSCSSLGVKVGGGLGTAAVGWLLKLGGYIGTAATQTEGAINMIFNLYITFPVILGVVITVLLAFLNVEKENQKIDSERNRI